MNTTLQPTIRMMISAQNKITTLLFLAQGKIKILWYAVEIITRIIFKFTLNKCKA